MKKYVVDLRNGELVFVDVTEEEAARDARAVLVFGGAGVFGLLLFSALF